jgi:hypothetical protein
LGDIEFTPPFERFGGYATALAFGCNYSSTACVDAGFASKELAVSVIAEFLWTPALLPALHTEIGEHFGFGTQYERHDALRSKRVYRRL